MTPVATVHSCVSVHGRAQLLTLKNTHTHKHTTFAPCPDLYGKELCVIQLRGTHFRFVSSHWPRRWPPSEVGPPAYVSTRAANDLITVHVVRGPWRLGARESLAVRRVLPASEGPFQLGDSLWRDNRRGGRLSKNRALRYVREV